MQRIDLPKHVEEALLRLEIRGFEAYVVGGAVRDALLGAEPTDWDITTSALPDDVKEVFGRHYETGIKHGTVTAVVGGLPIEVTTFRTEGGYTDFRHPDSVAFSKNLYDDLIRRDFTVNALAFSERTGIVDVYGGIDDLKCGIIRCIGKADERFREDALRILRAIRFSATLGFQIESATYDSICKNARLLEKVSGERICGELTKIIMADKNIEKLFESGVGNVILPELSCLFSIWQNNSRQIYDVGNHSLEVVYNAPKTPLLRYAALLHDIGKAKTKVTDRLGKDCFPAHAAKSAVMARQILNRLKMSNKARFAITYLIINHETKILPDEVSVRRTISKLGKAEFADLIALKRANIMGHNPKFWAKDMGELDRIEEIYLDVMKNNYPVRIKDLAVGGNDMKELGFTGFDIGKMLRMLLCRVIKRPELNTKEVLLDIAAKSRKKAQ